MIDRALIVKKEHLDRIFDNNKRWEMRSSRTNVRGKIGLIESGSGLIVGEVVLSGCGNPLSRLLAEKTKKFHQVENLSLLEKWKYPWKLKSPKRYEQPIPYNHPKGAVIWVKLNKEKTS